MSSETEVNRILTGFHIFGPMGWDPLFTETYQLVNSPGNQWYETYTKIGAELTQNFTVQPSPTAPHREMLRLHMKRIGLTYNEKDLNTAADLLLQMINLSSQGRIQKKRKAVRIS